jgi:protein-tyrosine phosphatase
VTPAPAHYAVSERLLAGAYPANGEAIEALVQDGVTLFVDLTHPSDPLRAYGHLLRIGRRVSHPIRDMATPTSGRMMTILDEIDTALADGESVYVHCWGGVGRTGTVVGCWLVRHGFDQGDVVARIATLRRDLPGARQSPETPGQTELVRGWRQGW